MAKMMPPHCDDSIVSNAERRIFDLLKNDPDTASWVVLHSLALSRRAANKPYGEIDFVVLVPDGGVVCLEVKGGRITCSDGIWYTTDRRGRQHQMKRSPFMQAREGMFALRDELLRYFGAEHPAGRCVTGYAAVFPDVPSPPQTPEFESWESIDSDALRTPISRSIRSLIKNQRKKLGRSGNASLSPQTMREIRQFLRPDFDAVITRSVQIRRTEEKLLRLTEEQYDVLDRLGENERCLIKGPAGTGKTLLGLEYARRSAAEGMRTLFVCYNRMLGDWIREQTADLDEITCGSFYRCLRELIIASPLSEEFKEATQSRTDYELFNEVFPFYGELVGSETNAPFDMLVLDEAQDLLKEPVLNVLNAWLKGGLAGGRWAIIGDFTRQAIYTGSGEDNADLLLQQYCPYYTRERLTLNCRNTRQVAEETGLLSGFFSLPYRLGRVEGLAVDYRYWRNSEHQAQVLFGVIEKLLDDGVNPEDIIVLSPRKFWNSVAYTLAEGGRFGLYELRERNQKNGKTVRIPFSTIHAFKGMESPVVVMCDLDTIDSDEPQALLYVGMSRARSHLTILLHNKTQPAIAELATRKLREEWTR